MSASSKVQMSAFDILGSNLSLLQLGLVREFGAGQRSLVERGLLGTGNTGYDGGIKTILDLVQLDPATVRNRLSVVLERTVRELQGTPCIGLENLPSPKKEIANTRSLGQPVTELVDLIEAVTEFASRAAVKLRKQASQVI